MAFGLPLTMPSRNTLTPGCYNLRIMSAISAQSYWDASISIADHRRRRSQGQHLSFTSFIYSSIPGAWALEFPSHS